MESNLRSLYCFIVAAEEMNFTRAAKKLYITQQSLSKHIKKLEEQYEVTLFDRHPALRLTIAGERLLAYARRALREENRLFNDLQSEIEFGRLRLRVGIPTLRCASYLPDVYRQYQSIRPNVVTTYISYGFSAAETALMSGDIDLYFSTTAAAGRHGRQESIVNDDLFFVATEALLRSVLPEGWEDFLSRHVHGIRVEETVDFPVVLPPASSTLREILNTRYQRAAHTPQVVMEVTDNRVTFDMCARNFCAAFISKSLLFHRFFRPDSPLYAIRVTDMEGLSDLAIVFPESGALPEYVSDYIACATEVITAMNAGADRFAASLVRDGRLLPVDYRRLGECLSL